MDGLLLPIPLSDPDAGAVSGVINFALRFDEATRRWQAFVPAFDACRRDFEAQEDAATWAVETVAHALAAHAIELPRLRRRLARTSWEYIQCLAAGAGLGSILTLLATLASVPIGAATDLVCIGAGLSVGLIAARLVHGMRRTPAVPPRPNIGRDGWPVD